MGYFGFGFVFFLIRTPAPRILHDFVMLNIFKLFRLMHMHCSVCSMVNSGETGVLSQPVQFVKLKTKQNRVPVLHFKYQRNITFKVTKSKKLFHGFLLSSSETLPAHLPMILVLLSLVNHCSKKHFFFSKRRSLFYVGVFLV